MTHKAHSEANAFSGKGGLRPDIVAGLTAAAVVLPKAMAYATVAGLPVAVEIVNYAEHAIGAGTNAKAAAYIELRLNGGRALHGIGIDENLTTASFRALFSAINRALRQAEAQAA